MAFISLIEKLKGKWFFQLFTVFTRYLIGCAFIISAFGMKKLTGSAPDTDVLNPPTHRIGLLFYTLSISGFYWKFIGFAQIVAGLLLITQRFARLGAVIFFPIILNIFIITVSYQFKGTPVITGLMLLATIYLLLWDLQILQYLIINPSERRIVYNATDKTQQPLWVITGLVLFITILILMFLEKNYFWLFGVCMLEGILALVIYVYLRVSAKRGVYAI
jgi:hypothetical protein